MKLLTCVLVVLLVASGLAAAWSEQQQQQQQKRVLRRVIKSTPTATNLARVRLVTVRATDSTEKGAVSEISSKEAASFGQRSSNETSTQQIAAATKTKPAASSETTQSSPPKAPATSKTATPAPTPTASASTTTTTSTTPKTTTSTTSTSAPTPALSSSSTTETSPKSKASERQQAAPEVELMTSAQSSWQMMSAVEAPAAALISAGTRPAAKSDISNEQATSSNEFSRSYSSLRQQTGKTRQHQASFYPPPPPPPPQPQQIPQQLRQGKTSTYQATKTQWYLPTTSTTSTTTPRPAPLVQEPQYEQYVEQQVDSAPPGQAEPFAFDFNTQDTSGNGQYRKEESDSNGIVRGSYGFRDASGLYRHVDYIADHNGFRASIRSNEPGLEGGRDSQPASIKLDSGPAPARFTSSNNADWTAAFSSGLERADLALADPDFESSHKNGRIRVNFRD